MALVVESFGTQFSNARALEITDHQNLGTISTRPPGPMPGETYSLNLEGGPVGQLFTLVYSLPVAAPTVPFPTPAADMVLNVDLATMQALLDGIGLFGPSAGLTLNFDPLGTPPGGFFTVPNLTQPNPPVNVSVNVQNIILDPGSPVSFRLSHALVSYGL